MKRSFSEIVKRVFTLITGLVIIAFGVAFSIKAGLGTSTISSLPYVISCFTELSVGTATSIINCFFVLFQFIVLGKKFDMVRLLQIPTVIVFGFITDFAIWVTDGIQCTNYLQSWIFCLLGILCIGVGVSLEIAADITVLPGEGIVSAICKKNGKKFGNVKIIVDSTLVLLAVIVSLLAMHKVVGVREGTLAAAVLTGLVVKAFSKPVKKITDKFYKK